MQENHYLQKHALFPHLIQTAPAPALSIVIVIPAFAEDKVLSCLESLSEANPVANISIEVLVVINHPENVSPEVVQLNEASQVALARFACNQQSDWITFHSLYIGALPTKQAGVGVARKIGMDEAVRRLALAGNVGIIVNLDADCTVAKNYVQAIWQGFLNQPRIWAASVYFEHPLEEDLHHNQREAIILYELHLRYFIAAQRYVRLPFAFHTVGSSMAVRSEAYQKMGGMNIRKAGEDFYFLHKFSAINRLGEINDTVVFPASRPSFRVPFGTGRAITAQLNGSPQHTYQLRSFLFLIELVERMPVLYRSRTAATWIDKLPFVLRAYLNSTDAAQKIDEIRRETNRYETFGNRFFQWFNAFRLMKFLHYARSSFPDVPVYEQALAFANLHADADLALNSRELLQWYRHLHRTQDARQNNDG